MFKKNHNIIYFTYQRTKVLNGSQKFKRYADSPSTMRCITQRYVDSPSTMRRITQRYVGSSSTMRSITWRYVGSSNTMRCIAQIRGHIKLSKIHHTIKYFHALDYTLSAWPKRANKCITFNDGI